MTNTHVGDNSESQPSNGQEVIVTSSCLSAFDLAINHAFALDFWASPGGIGPARAILLQPKLSQTGLCLLTSPVLLAVVALGVILGMTPGQAELGITLSAVIAGTFALAGSLCRQRVYDCHPNVRFDRVMLDIFTVGTIVG